MHGGCNYFAVQVHVCNSCKTLTGVHEMHGPTAKWQYESLIYSCVDTYVHVHIHVLYIPSSIIPMLYTLLTSTDMYWCSVYLSQGWSYLCDSKFTHACVLPTNKAHMYTYRLVVTSEIPSVNEP